MTDTKSTPINEKEIINVILFGETGVGKSTFINSIANNLRYKNFADAENGQLLTPIPVKFRLTDEDFEEHTIEIGSSSNEISESGVSATRNPESYIFDIKEANLKLRFIDTPGIGDTRGIKYDQLNTEKILSVISELDHVNALVVLLKPNNSRFNVLFNYCINHLLSKLDKKTFENIVFVFTNSRASFYTPGDTYLPLKTLLNKIAAKPNGVRIPFEKKNTFCIDNEAVRYFAARTKGFKFTQRDINAIQESWEKTSTAVNSMIDYIKVLKGISMKGTISLNEARRIVSKLSLPVLWLIVAYEDEKKMLSRHEQNMSLNQHSLTDLKKVLYVPRVKYDIVEEQKEDEKTVRKNYNQWNWWPPSYEFGKTLTVTRTKITTMTYTPTLVREEDSTKKSMIESMEEALAIMREQIVEIQGIVKEYEDEEIVLMDAIAYFTIFLKENAIVYEKDPFEQFLVDVVQSERSIDPESTRLEKFEYLLQNYLERKKEINKVTAHQIEEIKDRLLNQKHTGKNLKQFYEKVTNFHDTIYVI